MTSENSKPSAGAPFTTQVEAPEPWQRVIKVEVPRAHFDQEFARRLHAAARRHSRPGFRKGKVPKAMVERDLGDNLRAETLEHIVPQAFKAAIVEHELVPITDPTVRNLVFEADQPISFEMEIEVRPKVALTNYDDLPLRKRDVAVADNEIDDVLERLRESHVVYEKVDRAAQAGDQVLLDLTPLGDDGEPVAGQTAEGQRLELGAPGNIDTFEKEITGVVAGDQREVVVSYPEDHHSEQLRGKQVTYHCLVNEVQQKILPDLDDDFTARIAEGATLLELRQRIRSDLESEEEKRIRREMEEQIVDTLIERHEVAVPPSLVDQYLKSGLEELHGRNTQLGRPSSPEEDEQYRQTTKPVAERVMKGMFIMEAIRRQENIQVTDEEIDEHLVGVAEEHGFDLEKYREWVAQSAERDRMQHSLEERKTFDFLLSRAAAKGAPAAEAEQ